MVLLHVTLCLRLLLLTSLLAFSHSEITPGSKLHTLLRRRDVSRETGPEAVAVAPAQAKEFLGSLRRPRRNIWDRSRPDVQQWIMQFTHMGYDEAYILSALKVAARIVFDFLIADREASVQVKVTRSRHQEDRLETDLSYWMDHSRSSDQGRQHHYDENAPIGPQDPSSYRHGANVNYDYY